MTNDKIVETKFNSEEEFGEYVNGIMTKYHADGLNTEDAFKVSFSIIAIILGNLAESGSASTETLLAVVDQYTIPLKGIVIESANPPEVAEVEA